MSETEYCLVADKVIKRFGEVVAVNNFSPKIEKGKYYVLLGPSGCGKTTFLRCVAGLEEIDGGELYLNGKSLNGIPANHRDTAIVWQDWCLFSHKTVYENIEFGLKMKGLSQRERKERVQELLHLVKLEGLERRRPDELSGGQKQRVSLARGLAPSPALLLLDEPMGNLDRLLRSRMRVSLKRIQRETNSTVLHVTHSQEEGLSMADQLIVMKDGDIQQKGTAREIYTKPMNTFIADFMGNTNIVMGKIVKRDTNRAVLASPFGEFTIVTDRQIPQPGLESAFAIRAEIVKPILNGNSTSDNQLTGEVIFVHYTGDAALIHIKVPGADNQFLCEVSDEIYHPNQDKISEGKTITVGWSARDSVLLEITGLSYASQDITAGAY
jgi:ABC-type Fe3+/spermidine/putrescine transport system ATPase subunit